jgi:polar amino acid transport system substrate-binding protein
MKYLLLFLSFFAVTQASASYSDLQLNTDNRPPFEYLDNEGLLTGVAAKLVTCSLDKLDVKYEIEVMPWSRAQKSVEAGIADGFFAASQNDGRDKYAQLSTIIVDQHWNWYLSKSITLSPSSEAFKKNVKVSSWIGSNSLKWLKKNNYKVKQPSKHNKELVKRLLVGRIEGVYASNIVFEKALNDLGENLNELNIVKGMFKPMGVYFSKSYLKNNPGFMEEFNSASNECK